MKARRVAFGVAANIFDKSVIALVQLLSVPVFAMAWGINVYGGWVLLSTIPSFLAVSDFGFASAAGTRMTMLAASGDRPAAVRVFQSAWAVILMSSALMIALALLATWLVPASVLPHAQGFDEREARITLSLLLLYGIVALQGSIFTAGFRCAEMFAVGMMWAAIAILVENMASILVVLLGARPMHAAAALLICRSIAIVVQNGMLRRMVPWLRVGLSEARQDEARALLPPALAVMALPLGQASFLQGTALALGIAVSQAAVPAFTATRTLSRIGLQMTQLLNNALMPEYSAAVARDDRGAQATMLALTLAASAIVVVPFALTFVFFGPQLVALWTHGVIRPDRSLMIAMAVTVVLGGIWNPLSNLILAMNRHAGFAYPYVALGVATIPATYLLARQWGATGAGISIALLDAGMCLVILRLGRRLFVSRGEVIEAARTMHGRLREIIIRRRIHRAEP